MLYYSKTALSILNGTQALVTLRQFRQGHLREINID
jgi:hypothetical protein